jgi:S-DNA-T family DNA segregation ATPase FtsK/SpoIIIE
MSEKKKSGGFAALEVIVTGIGRFIRDFAYRGMMRPGVWNKETLGSWATYLVTVALIAYGPRWNLPRIIDELSPFAFTSGFGFWIARHIPRWFQIAFLFLAPFTGWLVLLGVWEWIKTIKYQKAINHLGLKTPTDLTPKVIAAIPLENRQRKLLVKATGFDVAAFRERKGALESSFNAIVQDVRVSESNKSIFEVILCEKELPKEISFDSLSAELKAPYSFLVGESLDGLIVAHLSEIHHMLVAGATGGGKSVFFKQALVGLLKSSEHIQLYLLDLKRGVDMKPFEELSNVRIAKDMLPAVSMLQVIVEEMEKRFVYLEKNGYTEIESKRDKFDRIVVGIDEASVLFTIEKNSKATKELAENARELTDKIAKLGRAAGIHVILATQKVVKETIDTRVQTNINARMCFRVNTIQSSMTVLGNKKAAELPEIKGRGIWSVGSTDIVVQVPKLLNEEVIEEVGALVAKFNGTNSPLLQPMLDQAKPEEKPGEAFVKKDTKTSQTEQDEGV